jgi:uncharacterized protein DUF1566
MPTSRSFAGVLAGAVTLLGAIAPAYAINIVSATLSGGVVTVSGHHAVKSAPISWEGTPVTTSTNGGAFRFTTGVVPADCVGTLSDGTSTISVAISGCTPPPTSSATVFPATGQTTCWDSSGAVIACTDTGQDGEKRAGAPLSYTSNSDGTITDNNTGLVWEKQVNCSGGLHCVDDRYTWQEALDYVKALNTANFAGHSDWRLPNVRELQSIVNYGPALSPEFNDCLHGSCTAYDYYWSSTTYAGIPSWAWWVHFGDGVTGADKKSYTNLVRAVRGGS